MKRPIVRIRIAFAVAVAFFAATIGDGVVEAISNSGSLWKGNYTDNSSLDLLPMFALTSAALLSVLYLIVRSRMQRGYLASLAFTASRALHLTTVARLLPAIVMLQLATLFIMETSEQSFVYGHVLGGTLWLGGPMPFALAMHFIFGSSSAFVLAIALSFCAEQVLRIVRILTGCLLDFAAQRRPVYRHPARFCYRHQWLLCASLGERGPPGPGLLLS